jgi:hypothetical protein
MRTLRYVVVLAVVVGMTTVTRSAAAETLITGAKIKAADATQPGVARRKIIFASKDPAIGISADGGPGDPSLNGGSVRIVNTAGSAESQLFSLAAGNWRRVPRDLAKPLRGWKYKEVVPNPPAFDYKVKVAIKAIYSGAVLRVVLKDDRGSLISYTLDEPMQGSVGVQVSTGADRQCANFGGTIVEDSSADLGNGVYRGVFVAKGAPAPSECASPSGAFVE